MVRPSTAAPAMSDDRIFEAGALTAAIRSIVQAGGSSDREADMVATNLVEANLRGHDSHGVGVPRPDADPIVLDFATSKIAQGKTRVAYNKGASIAPDTIIDDHGNPTTDPRFTVVEPYGALLTFGEHKGSGLALICELLGGA